MLYVKTYVAVSIIHGLGLFAGKNIQQDELIACFDSRFDRLIECEVLDDLPLVSQNFIKKFAYKENGVYHLCFDNLRFMNHSLKPNTRSEGDKDIALRNIVAGEEITGNYYDFYDCAEDVIAKFAAAKDDFPLDQFPKE